MRLISAVAACAARASPGFADSPDGTDLEKAVRFTLACGGRPRPMTMVQPDSRATFAFPMAAAEMPAPPTGPWPGCEDIGDLWRRAGAGGAWGALWRRDFGENRRLRLRGDPADPAHLRGWFGSGPRTAPFLPDLGFSYAVSRQEGDQVDRYSYANIAVGY